MPRAHVAAAAEPQGAYSLPGMTAWDRSAIILLGATGFAFSYDALRQIAIAIHAQQDLSRLFPVFIDGFIAYGVRAIVLLRHQRFGARLYAWFLFLAATGASLGANALHAVTLNGGPKAGRSALRLSDPVVGVLSTLAPLALAGSVHLYILMARNSERAVRDRADGGPGPVRQDLPARYDVSPTAPPLPPPAPAETGRARAGTTGPSAPQGSARTLVDLRKHGDGQASGAHAAPAETPVAPPSTEAADGASQAADRPDGQPTPGVDPEWAGPYATAAFPPVPGSVRTPADGERPPVPDDGEPTQDRLAEDPWLDELLPIARDASRRAGRISRDAVKEAIRAHQPIANDRLGVLVARLREEADAVAEEPVGASSALW